MSLLLSSDQTTGDPNQAESKSRDQRLKTMVMANEIPAFRDDGADDRAKSGAVILICLTVGALLVVGVWHIA
jgi:hypothetical protein